MEQFLAYYDGYNYLTDDIIFRDSINSGNSEPYPIDLKIVKKYFNMFPHKNGTYIDVGTHVGTTIMPYSKMFSRIIGYEPFLNNYNIALQNIKNNNITNCELHNNGIYKYNCNGSILKHGVNSGCYYFSENESGNIKCKSLDNEMIDKCIENLDFLKIDTEGCELFVLNGGIELIKKYKPFIQFESNDLSEKLYGIKEKDIVDFLKNLGYIPFNTNKLGANLFFYCPNETLNIIPKNIFCFWTGTNELTENRIKCLEQMKQVTNSNVKLITINELENYILDSYPIHEAYQYLSEVHKADYLRTYFMHYYGGGYSDIKMQNCSWIKSFEDLIENKDLFGIGYKEVDEHGVAYLPYNNYWEMLIGNGAYIFRPNTDLTKKWYNAVNELLDTKLEALKKNPASHPRDCTESNPNYPIEWNEILGRIFHRLNYEYHEKIGNTLVAPNFCDYI
jgi:FkbM family methyltransferase